MDGFVAVHTGKFIFFLILNKFMVKCIQYRLTGAGNCLNETKYKKICKESCRIAVDTLRGGGSALEACEAAIIALENCEYTNAGYGSNLTWDGKVECEASIMDGSTLQFGACTNVTNLQNPISLARILCERQSKLLSMDRIPPMILSGEGALNYAKEFDLPLLDDMISPKAQKIYDHYRKNIQQYEQLYGMEVTPLDTVGAVVIDSMGNCAAGCSSGGLILKISGRVGQAATYGAGCWAINTKNKSIATCTTGNGEYLMKTFLAREIVTDLQKAQCPIVSLHQTFKTDFLDSPFLKHLDEIYGGALTLVYDSDTGDGEVLWSHTTQSFCIGHMSTKQKSPKVSGTIDDSAFVSF